MSHHAPFTPGHLVYGFLLFEPKDNRPPCRICAKEFYGTRTQKCCDDCMKTPRYTERKRGMQKASYRRMRGQRAGLPDE